MHSVWHFGNTTVRNPLRIREGLIVLNSSPLNGNLCGKPQELLFADELERAGVIEIKNKDRDYSDFGRKWRSCFSQLGFITHKFKREIGTSEIDPVIREVIMLDSSINLSGMPYEVTPLGRSMINSDTLQAQQECMLRSLLSYEIPSIIEPNNGEKGFKPFIFILQVLEKLQHSNDPRGLSILEMSIVQIFRQHDQVDNVLDIIFQYRARRDTESGRVAKRRVDISFLESIANKVGLKKESLRDYADVNFRYPRLTGLVSYKANRLVLNEQKSPIIEALLEKGPNIIGIEDRNKYLLKLWRGSKLPTDDEVGVKSEILRFKQLLCNAGYSESNFVNIHLNDTVPNLNSIRLKLEGLYQEYLEIKYAKEQSSQNQIREILAYLKKIDRQEIDQDEFDINIEDEPSYFEWAVWRAFLAINNLVNTPYEARRFRIDQDFLPMGCASGGGADMIFEFQEYLLVVEVTLTTSSRQEAAEGEPVRRHVAKEKARISSISNKPVYGLFLARSIDNNTAETFRIGVWYNNDEPEFINIVPLTLSQFVKIMESYANERFDNRYFRKLLDMCLIPRNAHAPAWKKEISKAVDNFLINLND